MKIKMKCFFAIIFFAQYIFCQTIAKYKSLGWSSLNNSKSANYDIRMLQMSPPIFSVTAYLPINGSKLSMKKSRPCNVAQICKNGWTALIRNLRITDEANHILEVKSVDASGWELTASKVGWLKLEYEVDYTLLDKNNYEAPREAAFMDKNHFIAVGRSLFITTPETDSVIVNFHLLPNWNPVAPWPSFKKSNDSFSVLNTNELTDNLIAFNRVQIQVINAEGFRLSIIPIGHWQNAEADVKEVLKKLLPVFVRLMGVKEKVNFTLVLLPDAEDESAGEAYRSSFAYSVKSPPAKDNRTIWGQSIGHEIFHYWNGWRLTGEDYSSTQWFHEGFTQYVADLAMVASGLFKEHEFINRISEHIGNYQKLTTSLENPGSEKGSPLYSAGALVAFCWDIQIRQATNGKRSFGDFLKELWVQTNNGKRKYVWNDIKIALEKTAPAGEWEKFYLNYIKGKEKIPFDEIFLIAGLKIAAAPDGKTPLVEVVPASNNTSKPFWKSLIKAN